MDDKTVSIETTKCNNILKKHPSHSTVRIQIERTVRLPIPIPDQTTVRSICMEGWERTPLYTLATTASAKQNTNERKH